MFAGRRSGGRLSNVHNEDKGCSVEDPGPDSRID